MWYQYVTGGAADPASPVDPSTIAQNVDSVMLYSPLQIQAIQEQVCRSRYNALNMPFVAWPETVTTALLGSVPTPAYAAAGNFPPLAPYAGWISGYTQSPVVPAPAAIYQQYLMPAGETFVPPLWQPGIGVLDTNSTPPNQLPIGYSPKPTIWDHLIFAYLLELTGVVEIFRAIIERVAFEGDLGQLSPQSMQFLRTTEWVLFSDPFPTSMSTSGTRFGRNDDEMRITYYRWMFGADLPHKPERAKLPWPADSYRDFFPTLEGMLREVWIGIENSKNTSGINAADPTNISIYAQNLAYTLQSLRFGGRFAREEFTAVSKLSWLGLALYTNNFLIQDLQCEAGDQAGRLENLAMRVNMRSHLQSRHIFNLAQPLSYFLQTIEMNTLSTITGAKSTYQPLTNNVVEQNAEVVIDEYSAATGIDLKAKPVSMIERTKAAQAPRIPPRHRLPSAAAARPTRTAPPRGNGHAT